MQPGSFYCTFEVNDGSWINTVLYFLSLFFFLNGTHKEGILLGQITTNIPERSLKGAYTD